MKKILAALIFLTWPFSAYAIPQSSGTVVSTCGTLATAYLAGRDGPLTVDTTGLLCTTASLTISGTLDVNLKTVNGATTTAFNAGVVGAETQRVTISTDTTAKVSIASGQIASGAVASGAFASGSIASGAVSSGAIASGAVASGAYASGSISDGAMVTLGAKADAKSTATDTTAITAMQVLKEISFMAQTPAALPANQSTNEAQINGITPLMGNGITGTGSQRVTIASDNTPFHSIIDTGSTTAVTQATGSNLHAVLDAGAAVIGHVIADTGSTTAVTQATGTNLHAVIDSGTITAVTAITNALPAGTAILGKVGIDQTTDITTNGVEIAPTSGAAAGIAAVVSSTLETGHVLKNAAGNLYGVEVVTTSVAGYLLVFNATAVPAAGAVTPVAACYAGAFGTCALNFMPPLVMSTGISVAFSASTTPFTKTDSATAFLSGQIK